MKLRGSLLSILVITTCELRADNSPQANIRTALSCSENLRFLAPAQSKARALLSALSDDPVLRKKQLKYLLFVERKIFTGETFSQFVYNAFRDDFPLSQHRDLALGLVERGVPSSTVLPDETVALAWKKLLERQGVLRAQYDTSSRPDDKWRWLYSDPSFTMPHLEDYLTDHEILKAISENAEWNAAAVEILREALPLAIRPAWAANSILDWRRDIRSFNHREYDVRGVTNRQMLGLFVAKSILSAGLYLPYIFGRRAWTQLKFADGRNKLEASVLADLNDADRKWIEAAFEASHKGTSLSVIPPVQDLPGSTVEGAGSAALRKPILTTRIVTLSSRFGQISIHDAWNDARFTEFATLFNQAKLNPTGPAILSRLNELADAMNQNFRTKLAALIGLRAEAKELRTELQSTIATIQAQLEAEVTSDQRELLIHDLEVHLPFAVLMVQLDDSIDIAIENGKLKIRDIDSARLLRAQTIVQSFIDRPLRAP